MRNNKAWAMFWTMTIWIFISLIIVRKAYLIMNTITEADRALDMCKLGGKCENP